MFEGEPWKNPFLNDNYEKVNKYIYYIIFYKNIGFKSILYKKFGF